MEDPMRKYLAAVVFSLSFLVAPIVHAADSAPAQPQVKEWTFLTYLNGKNNLDSYGAFNINQMEKTGSTADINVLVQWASSDERTTRRLFVTKDNDTNTLSSLVAQDLGPNVDMGDAKSLVDFVRWGVANYPARHYFINIWNHGNGWHAMSLPGLGDSASHLGISPMDISWDEETGNHITTEDLGKAMAEAAKIIGHKVDIYGSDACLMAMAEVADEMSDSVAYFVGSEEVEPGTGWPYDTFMKRWGANGKASPADVSKFITEEYVKAYSAGGTYGSSSITFSAFDLSKLAAFNGAVSELGKQVRKLDANGRKKVTQAISQSLNFTNWDYVDLLDWVNRIEGIDRRPILQKKITDGVKKTTQDLVIAGSGTGPYSKATGLAIWLPSDGYTLKRYIDRYNGLKFNQHTGWGEALKSVLQDVQ